MSFFLKLRHWELFLMLSLPTIMSLMLDIPLKPLVVAAIGLFLIPDNATLTRVEGSGVVSDLAAEPVVEFTTNGVAQGFIEQSNVNAVMEMSHLITVSRAFENLAAAIENNESTLQSAIRTLGETS